MGFLMNPKRKDRSGRYGQYFRVMAPAGFEGNPDRKAYYHPTKNAASDFKARIKKWKINQLVPGDTLEISDTDKRWIGYLRAEIGNLDQVPAIVAHWKATAMRVTNSATVLEMCDQYLESRKSDGLGVKTMRDIRYRLKQFSDSYGRFNVGEITTPLMRSYFGTIPIGNSRRNSYKWLRPAFDFAKEQRMTAENPLLTIKRPEKGKARPEIYAPEVFANLLKIADESFPELLPLLALSGFAGCRSAELMAESVKRPTLHWEDILWYEKLIHIREEVAKQTSRESGDERFIPIEDALVHWLEPCRKQSGRIIDMSENAFRKIIRKLFKKAEIELVKNGPRHSYASYFLAANGKQGVGQLAVNMGNSEAVAKAHYIKMLKPAEGQAWFDIRRS